MSSKFYSKMDEDAALFNELKNEWSVHKRSYESRIEDLSRKEKQLKLDLDGAKKATRRIAGDGKTKLSNLQKDSKDSKRNSERVSSIAILFLCICYYANIYFANIYFASCDSSIRFHSCNIVMMISASILNRYSLALFQLHLYSQYLSPFFSRFVFSCFSKL